MGHRRFWGAQGPGAGRGGGRASGGPPGRGGGGAGGPCSGGAGGGGGGGRGPRPAVAVPVVRGAARAIAAKPPATQGLNRRGLRAVRSSSMSLGLSRSTTSP